MQLARLDVRPQHAHAARQAPPDRRRAVARAALLEARAARGLPERRAVRRQHRGRRRREPDLLRQVAGSRDARRGADARGDPAASRQPRRPDSASEASLLAARAQLGEPLDSRGTATARTSGASSSCRSWRGAAVRDADGRRRTSWTRCSPIRRIGGRASTPRSTRAAAAGRAQIDRYLTQYGPNAASAMPPRCSSTRATCRSRRGSARPTTGTTPHRRAGQRRAGEALAGLDAEAVRLRAGARPGRAASADDAARRADAFGPFTPENFDGRFFGPISAEER